MSKQKRSVLFLSSWYPNRTSPTNGNFVQRHAQAVAGFCDVCVIHAVSDTSLKGKTMEIKEDNSKGFKEVIVYYVKAPRSLPLVKQASGLLRYTHAHMAGLRYAQQQGLRFDIMHANVAFPVGWIARRFQRELNIPYIITEHWTAYLPQNRHKLSWYISKLSRKAYRHAAYACPVSHDLKNAIEKLGFSQSFRVIPNVVNTDLFQEKEAATDPFRWIHISTLYDDHKNISGMLRAFKEVQQKQANTRLQIIGDGPAEAHIRYAKELGISDVVAFEGEKSIEEISDYMKRHDAFVLFSNYENLPCVIIEAHASGLPVIATDVGGISEQIDAENGLLIAAKDEKALTEKMLQLMEDYPQYSAEKIRKTAINRYSYPRVGKQFAYLYEEILNPH